MALTARALRVLCKKCRYLLVGSYMDLFIWSQTVEHVDKIRSFLLAARVTWDRSYWLNESVVFVYVFAVSFTPKGNSITLKELLLSPGTIIM
ncbi:uncharacterized protein V6R79_007849 [Siganus canaliculatus]